MLISTNKRNNFRDFILILFRFEDITVLYTKQNERACIDNQEYQPKKVF